MKAQFLLILNFFLQPWAEDENIKVQINEPIDHFLPVDYKGV